MISYAADILLIIFYFFIFGLLHSWFASFSFKEKLRKSCPGILPFYRIIYNLISLFSLYLVYELSPKPDAIIYELTHPYDLIVLIPQFLSLAGIIWSTAYFNVLEFTGIAQVLRFYKKEYNQDELDEKLELRIRGPYRISRHPLYFFTISFLVFRPVMSLFYLVFMLCIIAYFYIGSFYEEKKLTAVFGDRYRNYAHDVPRIVPYKLFSPYKS